MNPIYDSNNYLIAAVTVDGANGPSVQQLKGFPIGKSSTGELYLKVDNISGGIAESVTPGYVATTLGLTKVRILNAGDTARVVSAAACNVYGFNLVNGHSATAYFKFYNEAAATTTAADTPVLTIPVGATSGYVLRGFDVPEFFSVAASVRCVTEFADSGTTAPATLPIIELLIK